MGEEQRTPVRAKALISWVVGMEGSNTRPGLVEGQGILQLLYTYLERCKVGACIIEWVVVGDLDQASAVFDHV